MTSIVHSTGTVVPSVVHGFRSERDAASIVHPVIGSPIPDVSLRPAALRAGVLVLVFGSGAAAAAAEKVMSLPQVLTITDPDVSTIGMDFVVAGGAIELELTETRRSWVVRVPFQEVPA